MVKKITMIVLFVIILSSCTLYEKLFGKDVDVSLTLNKVEYNSVTVDYSFDGDISAVLDDNTMKIEVYNDNDDILFEYTKYVSTHNKLYTFDDLEANTDYVFKVVLDHQKGFDAVFLDTVDVLNVKTLSYESELPVVTVLNYSYILGANSASANFDLNLADIDNVITDDISVNIKSSDYILSESTDYERYSYTHEYTNINDIEITSLSKNKHYEIEMYTNIAIDGNVILDYCIYRGSFYIPSDYNYFGELLINNIDDDVVEFNYTTHLSTSFNKQLYYSVTKEDKVINEDVPIETSSLGVFCINNINYNNDYDISLYYYDDSNIVLLDTYTLYERYGDELHNDVPYSYVNVSLPVTSEFDFYNHLYTNLNNGILDFNITCSGFNCSEVDDYSDELMFTPMNFVHPYFNSTGYSYRYNATTLSIAFTQAQELDDIVYYKKYTVYEIEQVEIRANNFLNVIEDSTGSSVPWVRATHDYIISTTDYSYSCVDFSLNCDNVYDAYGALVEDVAVCEGYAEAAEIILRKVDYPIYRITSNTHEWNIIYTNDDWYHLDLTWDDPVFVTKRGVTINSISYDFCLINTTRLNELDDSNAHVFDEDIFSFMLYA